MLRTHVIVSYILMTPMKIPVIDTTPFAVVSEIESNYE
jgi:hypothetical protein